jgi:hypothetical protein
MTAGQREAAINCLAVLLDSWLRGQSDFLNGNEVREDQRVSVAYRPGERARRG